MRVLLPQQLVLQARFGAREHLSAVYEQVRRHLTNPLLEFELYTTPPKRVLAPSATFIEARLCPASNVRFGMYVRPVY